MKLRTKMGRFIITDKEREIDFGVDGDAAFRYAFEKARLSYTMPTSTGEVVVPYEEDTYNKNDI